MSLVILRIFGSVQVITGETETEGHSDSEEVVTPIMLDGTYLSRNFATLGPLT